MRLSSAIGAVMRFPTRRTTLLFALLAVQSVAAQEQEGFEQPARSAPRVSVPFDEWVAAGNREGIPWDVWVGTPFLGFDQRLELPLRVEVPGKPLAKLGADHELYLMARLADEHGHWIEQGWLGNKLSRVLPKRAVVEFRMSFFVLPGEYTLALVLYNDVTKQYSVHRQKVKAKPLKNDPLPEAFSSLPRAQLLPRASAFDSLRNAKIQSRLSLPVQTDRPLHFEVVMVLGPEEQRTLKLPVPHASYGFAVTALHVFEQFRAPNASFHLTVADPLRQQVVMQQQPGQVFEWEAFRSSVGAVNPGLISASALESGRQSLVFLRDLLVERLSEPLPLVGGKKPLRVVLLIGSPMPLPQGLERAQLSREAVGDALLFQFRFINWTAMHRSRNRSSLAGGTRLYDNFIFLDDQFDGVLKPAKPTRFNLMNPEQFRKAIAHIIRAVEDFGAPSRAEKAEPGTRSPL